MKRIKLIIITCIVYFFVCSVQIVILLRFVNPIVTPLMIIRLSESAMGASNSSEIKKEWKTLDEISPDLINAVVASEDYNFFVHNGFNWNGIKRAIKYNKKHQGTSKRGASTISQQTAKNVFLVPSRTWFRKGMEVYFTCLIELFWSKNRILEVYLNIVELGDGVYGVESASQFYFKTSASELTKFQAASLAAILPSPLNWSPIKPNTYLKHKIYEILILMNRIEHRSLN